MNQSLLSATPSIAPFVRKTAARTALVGLKEPHRALLSECFRQFGIESVVLSANDGERLKKEKFEACVMGLQAGTETLMEAARSSPSNSRCIIFGVGGNAKDALRFSKYGINAMFNEPMERSTVLKLIRATRALVVHEFRRYTRVQERRGSFSGRARGSVVRFNGDNARDRPRKRQLAKAKVVRCELRYEG
jgi:hypothetical protein